ncbi:cell division protein CrgA [Actinomyces bowdenii]|nr:cell division protein CrgA [Actinomyces bowdenii]
MPVSRALTARLPPRRLLAPARCLTGAFPTIRPLSSFSTHWPRQSTVSIPWARDVAVADESQKPHPGNAKICSRLGLRYVKGSKTASAVIASKEIQVNLKKKLRKGAEEASGRTSSRPRHSGNPAKAAKAREEESRAAANRVSRVPTKVKDTSSPRWYAPTVVGMLLLGLLWVVTTYLFQGRYPIPYFVENHSTDWLINGNLYLGFAILMIGFLGLLRWK